MYIIAIAGGSGSGKTTFAHKLVKQAKKPVSTLHMDSYYLPSQPKELQTKKNKPNYDHPKAFDWDLLKYHLNLLKSGTSILSPLYDFETNSRSDKTIKVEASEVIIFEGIFTLFSSEIREILDIMCFLHVDSDIRFARRMDRDIKERGRTLASVIEQYYETVRPMYQKFLDPQRQFADFIVGEETDIAASILSSKINELSDMSADESFDSGLLRSNSQNNEHKLSLNEI
jgi:uridine kinase